MLLLLNPNRHQVHPHPSLSQQLRGSPQVRRVPVHASVSARADDSGAHAPPSVVARR